MGRFGVVDAEGNFVEHAEESGQAKPEQVANEEAGELTEPFLIIETTDVDGQYVAVQPKERLASLDVFRGLSIAMMILVDNAGGLWPSINHSPWNGVTLADLVMPFFLFIVGVALALAYKRIPSQSGATQKAIVRSLKLFLLGALLQGGYFHGANDLHYGVDMAVIRWCGILQRIAFAYLMVAICEIWLPRSSDGACGGVFRMYICHWISACIFAVVYLSLLYGLYVPDWHFPLPSNRNITMTVHCGTRGNLGPACNAVGYVDRLVLGIDHLDQRPVYRRTEACSVNAPDYGPPPSDAPIWCQAPFDPEGILSSVSAVVTCFIGLHYGHLLVHMKEHKGRVLNFVIPAIVLLLVGYVLHLLGIRMNKPLYSFSYMCFTAGAAGAIFCVFYILVDIYEVRYPTILLEWMGMNSLIIYTLAATDVLVVAIQGFYWKYPANNLVTFVREQIFFAVIPSERWAMLVYVLFGIVCWCLIGGALKAKGVFWKF